MDNKHILPFLWLHGEDEETLRDMMRAINEANIYEVCLESRPHPDYAGDMWWRDVDIIIDECVKRGMKIWILDDSHFPTGFANGAMQTAPDRLRKRYLAQKSADVMGPREGAYINIADMMKPAVDIFAMPSRFAPKDNKVFADDEVFSIYAYPIEEFDKLGDGIDISDCVTGGLLAWNVPSGAWRVVITYLTRNGGGNQNYINLLDAESVDVLINAVYEKHYERYGKYFGNIIKGFFSDEPAVGNCFGFSFDERVGYKNMQLPWCDEIEGLLGEDFKRKCAYLWYDGGDALNSEARLNYMDACTKLISKNFSDRLGEWCRARGVMYIGHVIEDNNQHMRLGSSCGHFFRAMSGMDMAGIDDIGGQVIPGLENARRGNFQKGDGEFYHFALAKLGASLAQCDKNKRGRTMCEIFGAYGWDEGVSDMLWLANHFIVSGVNYYVPHAFSGKAFPDPDCPPHFYAHGHNPLYRPFGLLMKYMEKLCALFDGGKPVIDCCVMYNAESYWMGEAQYPQKPARKLAEAQREFLFWPADSLENMPAELLIVPECEHICPAAVKWISENPEKTVFIGALPYEISTGEVVSLDELAARVTPHLKIAQNYKGLRFYHYKAEGREAFMFFNEGIERVSTAIELPEGAWYSALRERYEAFDGALDLEYGEAKVYIAGARADYRRVSGAERVCEARYIAAATAEEYPVFGKMNCSPDKFSGTLAYECDIEVDAARRAQIRLDDANEVVEVFINGESHGFMIAAPYRMDVRLPVGKSIIRLEITNSLGNQQNAYSGGHFSAPHFARPLGITGDVRVVVEDAE